MDLKRIDRGPDIGDADVSRFEAKLGAALPHDYRRFLLATNGGRPAPNSVPHPDGNVGLIQRFYSLGVANTPTLRTYDLELALIEGVPLPDEIAGDDFGNLYCLAPASGAVYFWDRNHEGGEDPNAPTMRPALRIADSFDEFLAAIAEDPEPL